MSVFQTSRHSSITISIRREINDVCRLHCEWDPITYVTLCGLSDWFHVDVRIMLFLLSRDLCPRFPAEPRIIRDASTTCSLTYFTFFPAPTALMAELLCNVPVAAPKLWSYNIPDACDKYWASEHHRLAQSNLRHIDSLFYHKMALVVQGTYVDNG